MGTATEAELAGFHRLLDAILEAPETVGSLVREHPELLECVNNSAETVFHWLVVENCVDEMALLYDLGAPISQFDAMHALQMGHLEALDFVLKHGGGFPSLDPDVALRYSFLDHAAEKIKRATDPHLVMKTPIWNHSEEKIEQLKACLARNGY